MKIIIGADHGGFELKDQLAAYLNEKNHDVTDVGTFSSDSVDYPDIAFEVASRVADKTCEAGIIVCGSGIGVSIVANKVSGIRAALCATPEQGALAKQHNHANVICMGGRMIDKETAIAIFESWLATKNEPDRHERRVAKIHSLTGI